MPQSARTMVPLLTAAAVGRALRARRGMVAAMRPLLCLLLIAGAIAAETAPDTAAGASEPAAEKILFCSWDRILPILPSFEQLKERGLAPAPGVDTFIGIRDVLQQVVAKGPRQRIDVYLSRVDFLDLDEPILADRAQQLARFFKAVGYARARVLMPPSQASQPDRVVHEE